MNTKFDKPSILGAPPSLPQRKPRAARQLSAFRTNRPMFSKSRCAPQVDVKQDLSKQVTSQCLHKVVSSLKNLIRKDCAMTIGIPTVAKTPSLRIKNSMRLSSQLKRQSFIGLGRSDYKLSKTCLRWVPTGRIFKLIGLKWTPMKSTGNAKVVCITPTYRDSNTTNSYQDMHNLHVGAEFTVLRTGSPTKRLKVWRPKRLPSPVIGTRENRQC